MPHNRARIRNFAILIILCCCPFAVPQTALAQSSLNVYLESPDLSQFPKISLFLDVNDSQGKFISGMGLDNFSVYEDGFERIVNEVQELEPGLHTILAINLGATLSNRANTSIPTRYEETIYTIASWLNTLDSQVPNQYSLTSNDGVLVENSQEKNTFTDILQSYKPNLFNYQPDLVSLTKALELAAKPNLIAQSKQAILYVTPLPLDQDLNVISSLQVRAAEIDVPVHVWLVAPATAANAPAVQYLSQLAGGTGGSFLFFSEGSPSPDVEAYLGGSRRIYRLRYTSSVSQSGSHRVRVSTRYGNLNVDTPDIQFAITLNLPSATLINLPKEIKREYVENASGGGKSLQPIFTTLQALISFPDGYERQLKATRLYVDGEIVAENTEEPFDYFGWPIGQYAFSEEHLVAVEVEDILGFRSISPPVAIQLTVASLYPAWLTSVLKFINQGGWIPMTIIGLGGSVVAGLRLRQRWIAKRSTVKNDALTDPLLQSVPGLQLPWLNGYDPESSFSTNAISDQQIVPPSLVWNNTSESPAGLREIRLENRETIIGRDPNQASVVLALPSISPQHALLLKSDKGAVSLADLGSEEGTWVNYAPISSAGILLHNGDLVRFGRYSFRYQIGKIH